MATTAYVEYGRVSVPATEGSSIHAEAVYSEALAISGTTATTTAAATAAHAKNAGNRGLIARITTDDTACYVAVGVTPDPASTVAVFTPTALTTSARRYLPAGGTISLPLPIGAKVAVKAIS